MARVDLDHLFERLPFGGEVAATSGNPSTKAEHLPRSQTVRWQVLDRSARSLEIIDCHRPRKPRLPDCHILRRVFPAVFQVDPGLIKAACASRQIGPRKGQCTAIRLAARKGGMGELALVPFQRKRLEVEAHALSQECQPGRIARRNAAGDLPLPFDDLSRLVEPPLLAEDQEQEPSQGAKLRTGLLHGYAECALGIRDAAERNGHFRASESRPAGPSRSGRNAAPNI